jgi:apolipoprotein N-acyltransferase
LKSCAPTRARFTFCWWKNCPQRLLPNEIALQPTLNPGAKPALHPANPALHRLLNLHPAARYTLLLLLGISCIASFAPFGLWWLQIPCLAVPVWLTLNQPNATPWQHAKNGWVFGLGWTVTGMYWLFNTMHHYGHLPAIVSAFAVLLLGSLYLAPFAGAALYAAAWLRQRRHLSASATALLVVPACWALSEWMRGWLLTGVPWVVSGYAHTNSPLAGFAPLIGVYGIGGLVALLAACVALALSPTHTPAAASTPAPVHTQAPAAPARLLRHHKLALGITILVLGGGMLLRQVEWSKPMGQPISVRLLQGNISQETKFDRDRVGYSLDLYRRMMQSAPADLIAIPETALPLFVHQLPPDYVQDLQNYSTRSGSHLVLGLLIADGERQYANSAVGISPAKQAFYRYDKGHLVPFGEFVPWGFHWFVEAIGIPMADQTAGKPGQKPWQVKDQWVLPNICYEDLFGEEIAYHMNASRKAGQPVASILLNISNLAWFDDSLVLPQHLQISQMRALETARPMLRATNTGATAVINHDGSVAQVLPYLTAGEVKAQVQGREGVTWFVVWGNWVMLVLAGGALCFAWLLKRAAIFAA